MSTQSQPSSLPPRRRKPGAVHTRLILIAVLGWIGLSFASAAMTYLEGRSAKSALSKRMDESKPFDIPHVQVSARTQSCTNAQCHGSIEEPRDNNQIRGDEYHVWSTDPHANAFATLSHQSSHHILHNLGVTDESGHPREDRQEEFQKQWQNCLGCHETNQHLATPHEPARHPDIFREGISCESCHGDATNWLHLHYRDEWQKSMSADQKTQLGFIGGYDTAARIRQCSTCHVGSSQGDVNHDLIAAGHPALRFEYAWYQSRLPKHWRPERQKLKTNLSNGRETAAASATAHAWLLGQLVTSIVSLELQETRISGQGFDNIWPELADYNCFACHQELRPASYARHQKLDRAAAFQQTSARFPIPWGNWNLSLIPLLAQAFESAEAQEASKALLSLKDLIQQSPSASKSVVVPSIRASRDALKRWVDAINQTPDLTADRVLDRLVAEQPQDWLTNWDQSANILLGLAASYRDKGPYPDSLHKAMQHIRFVEKPQAIDSPQQFVRTDGDGNLTEGEWLQLLKAVSEEQPRDEN